MEPLRELLTFILKTIHLSPNLESGKSVRGGALSKYAGGSIHWYKVHLDTCFRSPQDLHAL